MADSLKTLSISSSWGEITVCMDNSAVVGCTLPSLEGDPAVPFEILSRGRDSVSRFILDVFQGKDAEIPPVGTLPGTSFQLEVWKGIASIPKGETRSYGELAAMIDRPRSFRAVANACGRNPVPLFIPCHRVIHSDGSLGGFTSGTAWKKLLLGIEQGRRF